jgi:putative ABC transport system permease protein
MHAPTSHSEPATPATSPARRNLMPLTLRLAIRELRGGLRGFGIFLACLTLGVWSIAAVGSLSRALTDGLSSEGRTLLGADLAFNIVQREASNAERDYLAARGALSSVTTMRAMANASDKGSALVELKAVDGAYPTVGTLATQPQAVPNELFAKRGDAYGAVADPALLARLDLKIGDTMTLGTSKLVITASLVTEPDRIAGGVGFGPRLMVSLEALRSSSLLQPGGLVRWSYRLMLPAGSTDDASLERISQAANKAFPEAGWDIRSRLNAETRFARNIERFTQFLALVGLTALAVGGVGVANAVQGFVERKRESIAVMKSLGAPGKQVVAVHMTQVMLVAAIGVTAGLALGAITPVLLETVLRGVSPIPVVPTLAVEELLLSALYGFAVAIAFALYPLGRAHDVPVAALFRDRISSERRRPRAIYLVGVALALAAIIALALVTTTQTRVAIAFLGSSAAAFIALRLAGDGLMWLVRTLPRPRRPLLRLAMANIHRPGAATPTLMLSLGIGVTLLTVIASVDVNLRRNLASSLPERAPSFFFIDIPSTQVDAFDSALKSAAPPAKIERVPMMRGRIVSLKGIPASAVKASEDVAWVLEGDRGLTFSTTIPDGSDIESGKWWPADYAGPPLVSFESDAAEGLGLEVGDKVVVNILGRNIEAEIASIRSVEWRSLGINFVMVFSPNAFAGAPHTHLATVTLGPDANSQSDALLVRDIGRGFPTVTAIRVRDTLEAINGVVGQIMLAVRAASGVVLAASLLVLGGAVAAGHRARLYDAVILKTLGASRARLIAAYIIEYGLIGLAASLVGLAAGTAAAIYVVSNLMNLDFEPAWLETLSAAALAIIIAITLGLAGSWRVLGQKPARHLRSG